MMCILKAGPSVGPNPVTGKGIVSQRLRSIYSRRNQLLDTHEGKPRRHTTIAKDYSSLGTWNG